MIVTAAPLGRTAYLKPRRPLVPEAAALEKIASDLAHDLDVRVPPVILTNPPGGWQGGPEVCASLVLYGFQLHWGAAQHGVQIRAGAAVPEDPTQHARAALLAGSSWGRLIEESARVAAARAFVFDSWVGQPDHNHPSNIAWGLSLTDESDHSLCFFDYEMAFGVGGWTELAPAPFPEELLAHLDPEEAVATISQVEGLPDETIRAVVHRIPGRFMKSKRKEDIIHTLVERRTQLRAALTPVLRRPG